MTQEQQTFHPHIALARYSELMHVVSAGDYIQDEDGSRWHDGIDIRAELNQLELLAGAEGFRFLENYTTSHVTWMLHPMNEFEQRQFAAYHASEQSTENTNAFLWHVNVEMPGTRLERKQYHITIADGDQKLDLIVNYGPNQLVTVEPYLPHEMDYTVHDGCNHAEDYCVLEDPETGDFQETAMQEKYRREVTQKIMGARQVAQS